MPTYDVYCHCGFADQDFICTMAKIARKRCPKCGKVLKKRLYPSGGHFRGRIVFRNGREIEFADRKTWKNYLARTGQMESGDSPFGSQEHYMTAKDAESAYFRAVDKSIERNLREQMAKANAS